MRRIFLVLLVMSLLFCGCTLIEPQESVPEPDQTPTQTSTEPPTQPTIEEPTDPATEPAEFQDKITLFLVERTDYYDSGYTLYNYDENYNIQSYDVFTIENDPMYSAVFSEHNTYGMPCKLSQYGETWTLSWFEDGKIKEAQEGGDFSGYQYEYDQKGDIIEKRGYYEGILQDAVYFEYDGNELCHVYCEGPSGTPVYEFRIENGVIVEKTFPEENNEYVYYYEYDKNGNLIEVNCMYEGEMTPVLIHTYKAVEVNIERAAYLLEQQKYLLSII